MSCSVRKSRKLCSRAGLCSMIFCTGGAGGGREGGLGGHGQGGLCFLLCTYGTEHEDAVVRFGLRCAPQVSPPLGLILLQPPLSLHPAASVSPTPPTRHGLFASSRPPYPTTLRLPQCRAYVHEPLLKQSVPFPAWSAPTLVSLQSLSALPSMA